MTPVFHREAQAELDAAVEWYEERRSGLGLEFAAEVFNAIELANAMPLAWAALDGKVRRILVHRFPYGVLYAPASQGLFILAVMHLRRAPDYWKQRNIP